MKGSKVFLIFFLASISCFTYAQKKTKAELQKEKQEQLQKIKEVEGILSQTRSKKQNSMGELNALNQRIKVQEGLISSIKSEITFIDEEIGDKNELIGSLENDLQELKKEYAKMLYIAQKSNFGHNKLTFIFSSSSFTQLVMRMEYLEQYSKARRKQAEQIQKVQTFLANQTEDLKNQRKEKNNLLEEQISQSTQLTTLKKKQNTLVANLQSQEKQLKKDLETTKAAVAKLDNMIENIIKEEIEKARRAETSSTVLSNSFAENKAKLPWPVTGFVSQKFGRHNHPVLKNIVIENNGINIQTNQDEVVKAIFNGEVRSVAYHPGLGNSIIIKHGDYFTVYAGLKDVFVKQGQNVTPNQDIGRVITNGEGISELRFQVRKNQAALNPEQWLSRN